MTNKIYLVGLALFALIGCGEQSEQAVIEETSSAPDRIFINGKILTVDEDFSIASALAVQGEYIAAVGQTDEIATLAGPDTEIIDLQGKTMIPGLIDNHIHYLRGTNYADYELRIHGVTSKDEVLRLISERADALGPDEWVFIIGGWHEQQFEDRPGGFTLEELNEAAPNNPIYIQRTYSNFYLNTAALNVLAPQLGDFEVGETGVVTDNRSGRFVMAEALKYFPFATNMEERKQEVRAFNDYLNSMGVTAVWDAGYLDGSYDPVTELYEEEDLDVRVFYALRYWAESARTAVAATELLDRESHDQRDDRFGILAIGEHVHGYLHDSTASAEPMAENYWTEWEQIVEAAARNGWQVNEHVMQDLTANRMMDIYERLSQQYPVRDARWVLGHADLWEPETIARARDLGLHITLANHTVKVPVEGRASPPVRAIQDSGILWGMGSDGTIVATYNPFITIWEYTAGKVLPNIQKYDADQVISLEDALIAHTRSNAYLFFMEDKIGTLESGKYADLVVLDRDYLQTPVDEVRHIKPLLTMVAGEVVYESPEL
jgi:predicted amidohydrolase YtcJ